MTYIQAALTILAHAERPLTLAELTAVAVADGLIHPRGRTPDRTMASVLYRRMAADPDAPLVARGGRFWLRERPLPPQERFLERPVRRSQRSLARAGSAVQRPPRRTTTLPSPPLHLPEEARQTAGGGRSAPSYAPLRRERAVARAGERATRLLERLERRRAAPEREGWDAETTARRLIAPLLAYWGYRGSATVVLPGSERGVRSFLLQAGGRAAIVVDVRRLQHDLHDDDAWRALGRAHREGARYAATTNGRDLRLYAVAPTETRDRLVGVLTLTLTPGAPGATAALLWLLSQEAVANGALDAYVLDCLVGAAMVDAFEQAESPLARALAATVQAQVGVQLPTALLLRHARLVLRGARERDGAPPLSAVAIVAAVDGPRLEHTAVAADPAASTANADSIAAPPLKHAAAAVARSA